VRLDIEAEIEPGTARTVGLSLRRGAGEETRVGYDAERGEVFLDRRRSGRVDFNPAFPGRYAGPLSPERGRVRLRVLVDSSSVEVFANGGATVISALVFPKPDSDGIALFADGGEPGEVALRVWRLHPGPSAALR
jgi:levanase